MDPRVPVIQAVLTLGFTAMLLGLLQAHATRHGGSVLRNLGARGWAVAIEVVFAAGMFSSLVVAVLATSDNVPVDWTPVLIWAPIDGALGAVLFFVAWRTLADTLPRSPAAAPQKG